VRLKKRVTKTSTARISHHDDKYSFLVQAFP
jgi:hypothetical protein